MSLRLKKSVDDLKLNKGDKVLVRVDFNVPIKDGVIQNDYRIRSAIPTIKKIVENGGVAILMSHLGRPSGVKFEEHSKETIPGYVAEDSLKPVVQRLKDLMGQPVEFAPDCMDADDQIKHAQAGDIIILENVRFYSNEGAKKEEDRMVMSKKLASYASYFVSDAFGTAHRDSATMTGIPKVLSAGYAGYLMEKEINYFAKVLDNPTRPVVAIVGGAKVSDKILLLENMLSRINKLVIGGAMAYTFLKAQGFNVGKSMCECGKNFTDKDGKEHETGAYSLTLLEKAKKAGVEVFLPIDHICNTEFKQTDKPVITNDQNILDDCMALDIGPKTIELYKKQIMECKTTIWNGPMGVFEIDTYSKGTFSIAKSMAEGTKNDGMLTIIGGGDSAAAAEQCGDAPHMSHVSTGGGASLELLEGKQLPGILALSDK